jgi:hypothetical protein
MTLGVALVWSQLPSQQKAPRAATRGEILTLPRKTLEILAKGECMRLGWEITIR